MNNLYGLFIFSTITLICRIIEYHYKLIISGDIIGLIMLFIYLVYKNNIPKSIENTSNLLLSNIGLLFVPIGVALVKYLDFMAKFWQIIIFASILTTITCLMICAVIFKFLEKNE